MIVKYVWPPTTFGSGYVHANLILEILGQMLKRFTQNISWCTSHLRERAHLRHLEKVEFNTTLWLAVENRAAW